MHISNVFVASAFTAWGFGVMLGVPQVAKVFWENSGVTLNPSALKVSQIWAVAIQIMLGVNQFSMSKLNVKDQVFFGKLHAIWWGICALCTPLFGLKGPIVIPNTAGMAALALAFAYTTFIKPPAADNKLF